MYRKRYKKARRRKGLISWFLVFFWKMIPGLFQNFQWNLRFIRIWKGDSCLVKFSYSYWLCNNLEKYEASKDYQTSFQLYSIIGREQASYLIDNNLYFISGCTAISCSRFNSSNGKLLPITYPKITESVIHDKQPDFWFGILIVDSLSFKLQSR